MSKERTDAQLEQWIGELEYFESRASALPIRLFQMSNWAQIHGPGQADIDYRVTEWLRREARALRFRRLLYGTT